MAEFFVPMSFFAMIFGIVYLAITAQHKEKMAMLEKGIVPPPEAKVKKSKNNLWLKFACTFLGVGWGLMQSFWYDYQFLNSTGNPLPVFAKVTVYGALGMLGAYLIDRIEYMLISKKESNLDSKNNKDLIKK